MWFLTKLCYFDIKNEVKFFFHLFPFGFLVNLIFNYLFCLLYNAWRFIMINGHQTKIAAKKMAVKKTPNDLFICFNYFDEVSDSLQYMNNTKVILNYVPCSWFCIFFGFLEVFRSFFSEFDGSESDSNPLPIFFWTKTLLNVDSLNNT